jgi:hypothetical protein
MTRVDDARRVSLLISAVAAALLRYIPAPRRIVALLLRKPRSQQWPTLNINDGSSWLVVDINYVWVSGRSWIP